MLAKQEELLSENIVFIRPPVQHITVSNINGKNTYTHTHTQ